MKYYWTIFELWGIMRDDGKIWITDGEMEGTVDDFEILLICRIKQLK